MQKDIILSPRLMLIASMTEHCDTFTDIGTDHALLPLWLLKHGICKRAVVSDINTGPLETAKKNAALYRAESDSMLFYLSDGLASIDAPGNGRNIICISGMGGLLIAEILRKGADKTKSYQDFLLSPHTKQYELRRYLIENRYLITDEKYVTEEDRLYVIIKAIHTEQGGKIPIYSDTEYRFGRFIDKALSDDGIREKLTAKYNKINRMIEDNDKLPYERKAALSQEAQSYREVLGL